MYWLLCSCFVVLKKRTHKVFHVLETTFLSEKNKPLSNFKMGKSKTKVAPKKANSSTTDLIKTIEEDVNIAESSDSEQEIEVQEISLS